MLANIPYDRARALEYARRWALDRNPLFFNFTGRGGDCTNFVSQCILAGCCVMNFTRDFGWYYISVDDRAPAWTGVEYFSILLPEWRILPPKTAAPVHTATRCRGAA